ARAAEEARARAAQEAARRDAEQRAALARQRHDGFVQLSGRAKLAFQQKNFEVSIQLYQSALGMEQSDEVYRELALARAAEDAAAREAALRKQREDELARTRLALLEERRRREAEEKARVEHDQEQYAHLLDEAQRLEAKGDYDAAVAALQSARQLR